MSSNVGYHGANLDPSPLAVGSKDVCMGDGDSATQSQASIACSPAAVHYADAANDGHALTHQRLPVQGPYKTQTDDVEVPATSEDILRDTQRRSEQLRSKSTSPRKRYVQAEAEFREKQIIIALDEMKGAFAEKERELVDLRRIAVAKIEKKDRQLNLLRGDKETELQSKNEEINYLRSGWRQAAKELEKLLKQGQGFTQVTDEELVQKVTQMRFNVRNFADWEFGSALIDAKSVDGLCKEIRVYLEISPDHIRTCLGSSSKRPMVFVAFLWAVLVNEIFGRFCWAGTRVHDAMDTLIQKLKEPMGKNSSASDMEAMRRFQMWRATTTSLLLEAMKQDQGGDHGAHRRLNEDTVQYLRSLLGPFSRSKEKAFIEQLFKIVDEALSLDMLISQQAAEISWLCNAGNPARSFNPVLMELQRGEKSENENRTVESIVAPGIIKRGKSNGEDFNLQNIIMKMEVSCSSAIRAHAAPSEQASRFPQLVKLVRGWPSGRGG